MAGSPGNAFLHEVRVEIIHGGADATGAKVQARLRACAAVTDATMWYPAMWESVHRVAGALRQRRRLSGRHVQILLREGRR